MKPRNLRRWLSWPVTMSHDIKNLLMPVLCGAELLKEELDELFGKLSNRDSPESEKSRALCHEVLNMVQEDVRRISDRVRELADCVKGMSAPPKFAPCQVANVVLSVFKTLDLMAKKKGVTLSSEGLDGLPPSRQTNNDSSTLSTTW